MEARGKVRFPIRFGRFNAVLMGALGMGRKRAYVELDGDILKVRMGWGFRADVHQRAIVEAARHGYVWWAYGVHGWRGRLIVNGSGHNIVRLRLDPPVRARVTGLPARLRELLVSLEDPDGFLAAIDR